MTSTGLYLNISPDLLILNMRLYEGLEPFLSLSDAVLVLLEREIVCSELGQLSAYKLVCK